MNPDKDLPPIDVEADNNKKIEHEVETRLGGFADMSEFEMPELDAEVAVDTMREEGQSFLDEQEIVLNDCLREYGLSKEELLKSPDYRSIVGALAENEEAIKLLYRESKNKIAGTVYKQEQRVAPERESGVPDDYKKLAGVVVRTLEHMQPREALDLGPVYHVKNQRGESIDIDSILFSVHGLGEYARQYILVAKDSTGSVLGIRASSLEIDAFGKEIFDPHVMTGHIATSRRQAGVATMMDTAFSYLVQQESNKFVRPIEWKVKNQNLIDLESLEREYQQHPSDALALRIQKKKQEQERWLALYGEGGRFNFQKTDDPKELKKVVTASRIAGLDRGAASDIYLEPDEEDPDTIKPRVVAAHDSQNFREREAEQIKIIIEKIKESLER